MKKKLKLGKLEIASDEVIERSQLSTIFGGSGGSGVDGYCYLLGSNLDVIDTLDSFDSTLSESQIRAAVESMCQNMYPVCQSTKCVLW
ncbi:hypothetical protein [Algoriphagus pacificus]|uniref:Bacteriocin-type signal sequence-containing protein n=1 Tax=Algoriphagus pacificus TaxID=2811234 RepID=A0ABS3CLS0_9BACT|nr:hypothetical protein [Algoriphagus pacificus]MBN7818030.1 hypothetical protein [Algoriphagus pacificus]